MAQLIEEVSVLAADKRRREPRDVNRPWQQDRQQSGGGRALKGFHAFLMHAAARQGLAPGE